MRTQLDEVLSQLLESELTAFRGCDPHTPEGKNSRNFRNGSYFRQVKTEFGPIKGQVPWDRKSEDSALFAWCNDP